MYLQIENGDRAGELFALDQPVVRVGSDPSCGVRLPAEEIPPHALTIELTGDSPQVYNRCDTTFVLGDSELAATASSTWRLGEVIELTSGVRLALVDDDDDSLSMTSDRESDSVEDASDDEEPILVEDFDEADDSPIAEKTKGKGAQIAVIGACLIVGALCLFGANAAEPTEEEPLSFDEIVIAAIEDEAVPSTLVRRFQYAEAGVVRGDNDAAEQRFAKLRDLLLRRTELLGEERSRHEVAMMGYVERRLSHF